MKNNETQKIISYINFMKSHYLPKDSPSKPTHTLMGPCAHGYLESRGSFIINSIDYGHFLKLYKSIYQSIQLHIVERIDGTLCAPFLVDMDFHFKKKT